MKNTTLFYVSALLLFVLGSTSQLNAQDDKSARPSPPATATATTGDLTIKIDYSSPGVKGRQVLGKLIPDGKIWRLGANEATTFEVNKDVLVEGQKLAAGKYAMFSMQDGGDWTIIFNTEPNQWGAYKYDESKDALRVVVAPTKTVDMVERMTFTIEGADDGTANVFFNWEYIEVKFSVAVADQK